MNLDTTLAQLVLDRADFAPVLLRHRIPYGFHGALSLRAACERGGVDSQVVLADLQTAAARDAPPRIDPRTFSVEGVINELLRRAHDAMRATLATVVPLAAKVADVHGAHGPHLATVRDRVVALRDVLLKHFELEEEIFFAAVAAGRVSHIPPGQLELMAEADFEAERLLGEVRSAADDFKLPPGACNSYRRLYESLTSLERDLIHHAHLENDVLLPKLAHRS